MRRFLALLCALLCACSDPPRLPSTGRTIILAPEAPHGQRE